MATKKKTKKKEKKLISQLQDGVVEGSRDIWLAGLGALATVEEEGSKVFENLVTRGKERESKGKEKIEGALEKLNERRNKVSETFEDSVSVFEDKLNDVLERFGVPSRKEMESLSERVETLNKSVENLAKKLDEQKDAKSSASKSSK